MDARIAAGAALLSLSIPGLAAGHLGLIQPTSRYGTTVLKQPPCGLAGGQRTQNVFTFRPGETITVVWDEYIDHPGHFRISFDADGDDDFVDPPCLAGCDTRAPTVEMYSNAAVLMDDIVDTIGGLTTVQVTLPDIECTNCTLQMIQVMYDKPPYTIPGNEMYYQCVDLVLVRNPDQDAGVRDGGTPDAGTPDAGVADAGNAPPDAGAAPADGGAVVNLRGDVEGGCRCVAASPGTRTSLLVVGLGFLVGLGRRRRTRAP